MASSSQQSSPWFSRFTWLTAFATLCLIGVGGLVTSKGVGMSVPDWPTSYGYNMFLFPISHWVGGIFYEHTHRLVGSLVGLLMAVLTVWVWVRESSGWPRRLVLGFLIATLGLMGVRTQGFFIGMASVAAAVAVFSVYRAVGASRPLRWWVLAAFCTVLVQGVLGGLRVTAMEDAIGIFHGTLAQLFLATLCLIAVATGPAWQKLRERAANQRMEGGLHRLLLATSLLILVQLILGASMRHQHAGLAVPDFPLAHGRLYPAADADSIARYNSQRMDYREHKAIQPFHIHLHMAHRAMAVLLTILIPVAAVRVRRQLGGVAPGLAQLAHCWMIMVGLQVVLGIVTVLKNKPADIATLHVMLGALTLVTGVMLTFAAREFTIATPQTVRQSRPRPLAGGAPQPQT